MTNGSDAFQRIEGYFEAFRTQIEKCRKAGVFIAADLQDAYARLARLRERYTKEKSNLHKPEREALSKVFEYDTFTKGMMNIRQVGEHIAIRDDFTIQTKSNAPITLSVSSSALAVFSAPIVVLNATDGEPHRLDHLDMLAEMEKRIAAAMAKARKR